MEQPVSFEVKGMLVHGMLHRSAHAPPDGAPGMIFYHGLPGDRVDVHRMGTKLGRCLCDSGMAVLRIDFRCSGISQGNFRDLTLLDELADARAAVVFMRTVAQVDPSRIALLGFSIGAELACTVAVEDPQIRSVVLWSPALYAEGPKAGAAGVADEAVEVRHGKSGMECYFWGMRINFRFFVERKRLRALARFRESRIPCLVVYGAQDASIDGIRAGLAGRGNADYLSVEQADHIFSHGRFVRQVIFSTRDWLADQFELTKQDRG